VRGFGVGLRAGFCAGIFVAVLTVADFCMVAFPVWRLDVT